MALVLLFLLLVVCLYWLGGQVSQMALLQRQQEEQIAQLHAQLLALTPQATGAAQARPGAGPAPRPGAEASPAKGSILSPEARQAVPEVFGCTVRVERPRPGHHYYLVLRQGARCWPRQEVKMPPGGATTAWEVRRAAAGPFTLELREVDQDQHQQLAQWRQGADAQAHLEVGGWLLDAVNLTSN
ncbi:MAG: hypothetical protein HY794_19340 [Desulfarculus sp.]|nr:hypothetical protein [Desulfarculus sp.]